MTPELDLSKTFLSNFKGKTVLLTLDISEALNAEIVNKRLLSLAALTECMDMMRKYTDIALPAPHIAPYYGITFRGIPGQYILLDVNGGVHEIEQRKFTESWSFYHSKQHGWVNREYCLRVLAKARAEALAA